MNLPPDFWTWSRTMVEGIANRGKTWFMGGTWCAFLLSMTRLLVDLSSSSGQFGDTMSVDQSTSVK
jgi:hypothetical protein